MKVLETERLFLTPTTTEDAEFILRLFNSPKWLEFVGDKNVTNIQEATTYISENIVLKIQENRFGNYTITRKFDDAKIGFCRLFNKEGIEGINIEFAFLPEYQKRGYGYESANKLKEVAFNDFNLSVLNGITSAKNIESQKLLEKLGLIFEKNIQLPNESEELLLYTLAF